MRKNCRELCWQSTKMSDAAFSWFVSSPSLFRDNALSLHSRSFRYLGCLLKRVSSWQGARTPSCPFQNRPYSWLDACTLRRTLPLRIRPEATILFVSFCLLHARVMIPVRNISKAFHSVRTWTVLQEINLNRERVKPSNSASLTKKSY